MTDYQYRPSEVQHMVEFYRQYSRSCCAHCGAPSDHLLSGTAYQVCDSRECIHALRTADAAEALAEAPELWIHTTER